MVLCAYLGQLAKVRDALSKEVAVVIDDRDLVALADQEDGQVLTDEAVAVERVNVSKRVRPDCLQRTVYLYMHQVRLRTVDNYQGEEAKVSGGSNQTLYGIFTCH